MPICHHVYFSRNGIGWSNILVSRRVSDFKEFPHALAVFECQSGDHLRRLSARCTGFHVELCCKTIKDERVFFLSPWLCFCRGTWSSWRHRSTTSPAFLVSVLFALSGLCPQPEWLHLQPTLSCSPPLQQPPGALPLPQGSPDVWQWRTVFPASLDHSAWLSIQPHPSGLCWASASHASLQPVWLYIPFLTSPCCQSRKNGCCHCHSPESLPRHVSQWDSNGQLGRARRGTAGLLVWLADFRTGR